MDAEKRRELKYLYTFAYQLENGASLERRLEDKYWGLYGLFQRSIPIEGHYAEEMASLIRDALHEIGIHDV